ncbi:MULTISPECIES: ribonuclease III [Peptoniphilus]|uniref:ribonuclease III n=1 Tax=Peptoniphilus TaxID=162289 RepID=UPI0008D918FD|nr:MULTISPECIES: ribonuclease III [Peptoniphilus]MBS6610067.1 ribonuclease III [Peptoniphilus harei]MDU1043445.1 ribonuclease III [Peptoniphilus rhinitidis]MDU1954160.1 ribonuclease III [Peptoniphilus lacydonensis]MDU2115896.1 ribonuclease III [Peptoniphilus lacydonensis]MDU3751691.1 ribonuclease III [Peptoniphilus rhinitidis]
MSFTNLELLEKKLNYKFKDIKLLKKALTHSSYVNENNMKPYESNERLEYLGDAVLGLIIGEYFYINYPKDLEGSLSKMRADSVNEKVLFFISKNLNLGDSIRFGKGEIKNGGRMRESTSADALEALIGAIYLDSNFNEAKRIVLYLFQEFLEKDRYKLFNIDFKTKLQEKVQKSGKKLEYKLVREEGPDNNKTFYTELFLDEVLVGKGKGKTKKESQQEAAKEAFKGMDKIV